MVETRKEAISFELDPYEVVEFDALCRAAGMTANDAIELFISVVNVREEFPFSLDNPYGFNEEILEAMRETEKMIASDTSRRFESVSELLDEISDK